MVNNVNLKKSNIEIINKFKNKTLSIKSKIYIALSGIPVADIVFQGAEKQGFNSLETAGLITVSAAIGYYINKQIEKDKITKETTLEKTKKDLEYTNKQNIKFKNNIETLELLLKNIPGVGFFMIDSDGKYTRVNSAFAKMIGQKPENVVGKTDKDIFPLLSDEVYNRLLKINQETLSNLENEENISSDNSLEDIISLPINDLEHVILLKKSPFIEDSKKIMVGISIDVTTFVEKQKQLEQEKLHIESLIEKANESARLKESFLQNMSHEIRTPLNGILGFSQVLFQKEVDPQKKNFLDIVVQQGKNLLSLINNILDISKLEAGVAYLSENNISIKNTINNIAKIQEHSIAKGDKNINIVVDESIDKIDVVVLGDEIKIQQILNNLIGNSIKFTKEGYILISCPKIEDLGDKQKIYISVKDTGIGIQQEKIDMIFDRFRQIDETMITEYGGTGLGLSLAKELSKFMGGDIKVESENGKGSTFTTSFIVKKQLNNINKNVLQ